MKLSSILNIFYKSATLKSDMADRIMYEISQSYNDSRVTRYPEMEYAASGAKNLIRYGTMMCIGEMKHYLNFKRKIEKPFDYENAPEVSKNNIDVYIAYLSSMEDAFNDESFWYSGYGGKSWGKIAHTLVNIANKYKIVLKSERYSKEHKEAIKDLLIQMNIFDGMAHNTGYLLPKLQLAEEAITGNYESNEDLFTVMHSKELMHPADTYRIIENYVSSKAPFSESITSVRNDPRYIANPTENIKNEIKDVQLRRSKQRHVGLALEQVKTSLSAINYLVDDIQTYINSRNFNNLDYAFVFSTNAIGDCLEDVLFALGDVEESNNLQKCLDIVDKLYSDFLEADNNNKKIEISKKLMNSLSSKIIPLLTTIYNILQSKQ